MEIKQIVAEALKEMILPELKDIKSDLAQLKAVQGVMNKRMDDMNMHIIELGRRIDTTNDRVDETNDRLNRLYEVIVRRDEHTKLQISLKDLESRIQALETKTRL